MYSILLSSAIAILAGALLFPFGWGWSLVVGIVAFLVAAFLISRRMVGKLGPMMGVVKRQMEARMLDLAMQTLRDMMPMARWIPLLKGQLLAQMGTIAYGQGKKQEALELLSKASRRAADQQLLLACIHYRDGDKQKAFQILQLAAMVSKKHSLLNNAYAWLLHKEERKEEAITLLQRYLKKQPEDENAKDNLLRLQNNQRTSMKGFGEEWFAFGLERPPQSMGQLQTARKGWRTPPKQPKQEKKQKKK